MKKHLFPWWLGYLLINPLRKLKQNPKNILTPFISKKDKVIDYGPAMGFFTIPISKIIGKEGEVICIDVQNKLLEILKRRCRNKNIENVQTINILENPHYFNSQKNTIDFILAFAVVHEVNDKISLIKYFYNSLKKGKKVLISEPNMAIEENYFENLIQIAKNAGFSIDRNIKISGNKSVILIK